MALVRGFVQVTVDYPDADGLIQLNKHGFGYTWRFREPHERPSDPNQAWEPTWNYLPFNLVRPDFYILSGCAPAAVLGDRSFGTHNIWTYVTVGQWVPTGGGSTQGTDSYIWYSSAAWPVAPIRMSVGSFPGPGADGVYYVAIDTSGTVVILTSPPESATYIGIARVTIAGGSFVDLQDLRFEPSGSFAIGATQYNDSLQACVPQGYAVWGNMSWSNWEREAGWNAGQETRGNWRLATAAHFPQRRFAFFDCLWPNAYGSIRSVEHFRGEVILVLYQFAPPWAQENPPRTRVELIQTSGPTYFYDLPLSGEKNQIQLPRLGKKDPEGDRPDEELNVAEWQKLEAKLKTQVAGVDARILKVCCQPLKSLGGQEVGPLIWEDSYVSQPWIVSPGEGISMTPYRLRITAHGHALAVAACQVKYPVTSYAQPYDTLAVPGWVEPTHTYYALGFAPFGTSVSAISTVDGTVSGTNATDRPTLVFTSDGHARPLCYGVSQIHSATIGSARTSATNVTGGVIMSARGSCDETWRGATCDFTMRIGADDYAWKGNEKVEVRAGWSSVTAGVKSDSSSVQFTGYIADLKRRKDPGDLAKVYLDVHCEDGIGARLSGKKKMLYHACYAGLDAAQVFTEVLTRAGVASSLIDTTGLSGRLLPTGERGSDLMWQFAQDYDVVSALDDMAAAMGKFFGVTKDLSYFMGTRLAYSGTPDYIVDDDSVADTDRIEAISAERANAEFRNYVAAIVRGNTGKLTDEVIMYDADSHRATASADFIGDDWWEVVMQPEATSAWDLALKRWREVFRRRQVLEWTTAGKHDLWPGHYVQVQAGGLGVPTNTVFRIVTKEWEIREGSGNFICRFGAIKEADA